MHAMTHARYRVRVAAGFACAVLALSPPVDALAHRHLSAHMAQHVALTMVAAPLLGWSVSRPVRHWWRALTMSGSVAVATLAVWHAPALYDAAVNHVPVHAVEHLTMLGSAAAFWWVATSAATPERRAFAVLAVFATTLPMTLLGAAMTFSRTPWYTAYPEVTDQQVAGAVMWGAGGALAALAAVCLLSGALAVSEARSASAASAGARRHSRPPRSPHPARAHR
jgi:cytochrome c oxidase assembly factor CtaG